MSQKKPSNTISIDGKDTSVILTVDKLSKVLNRSSHGALWRVCSNLVSKNSRKGKHDFEALKGVSFTLKKGDSLGIIGANGAGKSTLLKLLAGAYLPTKGNIHWSCENRVYLERKLKLYNDLPVLLNLKMLGILHGIAPELQQSFIDETLEFAELSSLAKTPLSKLSSGMKMRLILASYLWLDPDVILIDEALEVGDAKFRDLIRQRMHTFFSKGGSAVIVSHQDKLIRRYCNKLLVLDQGRVLDIGKPDEILARYNILR